MKRVMTATAGAVALCVAVGRRRRSGGDAASGAAGSREAGSRTREAAAGGHRRRVRRRWRPMPRRSRASPRWRARPPRRRPRWSSSTASTCHNDRNKDRAGSLTLAAFDAATIADNGALAEQMIRQLRAGMMPPPGAQRPESAASPSWPVRSRRASIARRPSSPNPGFRPFQRAEPCRVRARGERPARHRRRRATPSCRPTRSATASTTSPTSRRCRRR